VLRRGAWSRYPFLWQSLRADTWVCALQMPYHYYRVYFDRLVPLSKSNTFNFTLWSYEEPVRNNFEVTLVSINGGTDEESNNNDASFVFSITDGAGIVVALTTDAFALEASYTISDDMDNVVYTSQEYDEGFTTFEAPYCLDLEGDSIDISLDAMNFANNISIYPNPTVAQVIINHNFATLLTATLTDLSGRELLKAELSSASSTLLLPKNIAAGLYLLELTDGQNRYVQKLIVE